MKRDWRYFRNLMIFAIAALLAAFYVILPALMAWRAVHPGRLPLVITPAGIDQHYEDVTLTTRDGLNLYGWYISSKNGAAVIVLHAYNGDRSGTIYHADMLADRGYGVLMFDLRAHGQSQGDCFAFGWDADQDVFAGLEYLLARPDVDVERIGLLGLSIGAEVGLQAAARDARVQAIVAEGAGSRTLADWLISPESPGLILLPGQWVFLMTGGAFCGVRSAPPIVDLIPQISPRPVLLISAGRDIPFGRAYYAAAEEPKNYWERKETSHIDALFVHPEQYAQMVLEFFDHALLEDK